MGSPQGGYPRSGLAVAVLDNKVYVLGGHNGQHPLKTLEVYELAEDDEGAGSRGSWFEMPGMLARRAYHSAAAVNGQVYAVGGSSDGRTLDTIEVFDPERGAWALWFGMPPMQQKRTLHASAEVGGKLYVCGGFDGIRDLSAAERYDPATNHWSMVGSMGCRRSYLAVAVAGGSIYAIGGQDRNSEENDAPRALDTVEFFDTYSECWISSPALRSPRLGLAAATLQGPDGAEYVYAIGGSNGSEVLTSVERYDPREGAWEEIAPMRTKRLGHAAAAVGGRIYVFGGYDGEYPLDTMEIFDPSQGELGMWSLPESMASSLAPGGGEAAAAEEG